MKTEKYLKLVNEVNKIQTDHNDFYELAEKYGFYTPWNKPDKELELCSVAPNSPVV